MLEASCHCGAVHMEITEPPRSLIDCNCSICRRLGALWAFYTPDEVKVTCATGSTATYLWGDKHVEYHHCSTCGCTTHYVSTKKSGVDRTAVNARMMDPADIESVPIKKFDGADTWTYVDD
ncbi:MAG: GFA family protein [Gammaproteobacteria bacterium]|nr:GFA family protein [Gammaproteobacteria bacterium]